MGLFNVRVYGLLFDSEKKLLVSDEYEHRTYFTKFPGGGLEYGEGLIDGLKREFMEECNLTVDVSRHFYTTDFFIKSIFNDTQVISVYYLVTTKTQPQFRVTQKVYDFPEPLDDGSGQLQSFRWVPLRDLDPAQMTFETEQHVVRLLKSTGL